MSTAMMPDGSENTAPVPPHDLAAEQSVLGGMMLSPEAIGDVTNYLWPTDFYRPAHQVIYDAILTLYGRGEPADAITVGSELERHNELQRVGGAPYLHTLIATVPTAANAGFYAEQVAAKATMRRTVEAGTRITHLGYYGEAGADVDEIVDQVQAAAFGVSERRANNDFQAANAFIPDVLTRLEEIQDSDGEAGVRTGFADLDALLAGLKPGQLITVAARPGLGKSTLALDMVRSAVLDQQVGAAVFSLEMGRDELAMRFLSASGGVRFDRMRKGQLTDDDWAQVARASAKLQEAPLFIDDSPDMTSTAIRTKARRLKQRHGIGLIVVDYLQLMTSGRRVESRQVEVNEFSRNLKLLAKELEVPVVAISQLNRESDKRTDKKPQLSDLRESGGIENDSDAVVLIHRPDAFERDDPRMGEADLILAKQRSGPTGIATVAHQLHLSRFVSMAEEPPPSPTAPTANGPHLRAVPEQD